ncbi:hypothetical protein OK016_01120 [Vibrio chagasii]|nr:hypothetical protein [Vibrio chagasii]
MTLSTINQRSSTLPILETQEDSTGVAINNFSIYDADASFDNPDASYADVGD